MHETWFVMDDGSLGDPHEIAPDASGRLRHRDGRAVAYGPHGPRSRGHVDAKAERAKAAQKEMKPDEPKRSYKTRESKAD